MMANPRSVWSHVQIKRQIMTALRGPEEGGPVGFLVVAIGKLRFPGKSGFARTLETTLTSALIVLFSGFQQAAGKFFSTEWSDGMQRKRLVSGLCKC
jgi:energy-converting hydrogenase Eha subunit B